MPLSFLPVEASQARLCVPIALVLYCAASSDPKESRLTLRLLAPRSTTHEWSSYLPFKRRTKSRLERIIELRQAHDRDKSIPAENRLKAQLQGPCSDLELVTIEGAVEGSFKDAEKWADRLARLSYSGIRPHRKLKVLVNPVGGSGNAVKIFKSQVQPILEAAQCSLDVDITTHVNHGKEIIQALPLDRYDAIVCVSGDGMMHEILNGLAQRSDANEAIKIPVAPIPAGSGNAIAVNLYGNDQCLDVTLACLNIIKGQPMLLDVCSITQPAELHLHPSEETKHFGANDGSAKYTLHYTFLSQAIGLMAELDLGTEWLRRLGDVRFALGYLAGIFTKRECPVDVFVKLGKQGTINKQEMRSRTQQVSQSQGLPLKPAAEDDLASPTNLRNGAVTEQLPNTASLPVLDLRDASWYNPLIASDKKADMQSEEHDPDQWYRIAAPIAVLYAGKIPYVSRDTLCFPYSCPGDDCVELYFHLLKGGRMGLIRTILAVAGGTHIFDKSVVYLKVDAYRVVPRYQAGDKRLIKGGLVAIDGERRPYAPYQVEAHPSLRLRVLSLYGKWCVPDVAPPFRSNF